MTDWPVVIALAAVVGGGIRFVWERLAARRSQAILTDQAARREPLEQLTATSAAAEAIAQASTSLVAPLHAALLAANERLDDLERRERRCQKRLDALEAKLRG